MSAYMITGGKSLQKFHNTVCPDCKPIRTVDDNNSAEVRRLCSSCRSVPSPAGTWAIRTSRRASSTSSATPRCRVLTLYFSFSWVLILSSDLLHNFYSNSDIGLVPAMVEADTTRPSHTGLDRDFEPCQGVNATPFKRWYLQHYGVDIGRKKEAAAKRETIKEEPPQMQQHVP